MARIRQLSEHITNMIAAGEVVERPMGIVKECVENSIDAHASHIEVHIQDGGLSKITIIDDGDGMDFDDAAMAFERHATSKIKEEDDLWNIHSLGFRGEAIPSIASVSEVTLKTNNGTDSTMIQVFYGEKKTHQKFSTPKGTQIDIENLFAKTPARYKHLKTTQYEFSLISDVIQKFALGYPNISFVLTHNNIETFKTSGKGNLQEVLFQIFGRETAKGAIEINAKDDDYKITVYAIQPNINRATKYYMYIYMNQRMVRHPRLYKAIQDAYHAYMSSERYPIVVLNIEMDAQLLDVNVHPSKWEVRLSKEKQLENLIYSTIKDALKKYLQVPEVTQVKEKVKIEMPTLNIYQDEEKYKHDLRETIASYNASKESKDIYEVGRESYVHKHQSVVEEAKPVIQEKTVEVIVNEPKQEEKPIVGKVMEFKEEEIQPVNPSFPQLQVIGQFHGNYILAQGEKGLYIIDQHAAQEKYHYEVLRNNIFKPCEMQSLLIPEVIKVTPAILVQLDDINQMLAHMQIECECFGEDAVILREIPIWLKDTNITKFMQDIFDYYQKNQTIQAESLRKAALASLACHSSIRFNRNLTLEEMKQVVEDLKKCEQPFNCPHGRPTLICISDEQLVKEFNR